MDPLRADAFLADGRIAQARALVQQALAEHQAALVGPRGGDPQRKVTYDALLARFAYLRAGSLYYPYLGAGFGAGALVELADGSVKYDLITGIGVHYFGHSHPDLMAAALDAALRDTVMQGNLQQNTEAVEVADRLVQLATQQGAKLPHCFLTTSGAMANENALKLALQKHAPARRILALAGGFAGRTLALAAVTDKAAYREGLPVVLEVDYVPPFDAQRPQESTAAALAALAAHRQRYPRQHAAMVFEMVRGEGGYWAGDAAYFRALMEVLQAHSIAVIVDEIQTFGRTSAPFAFQHFGLDEWVDLVSVGKLTQVCATLFSDAYKPGPGLISQTFTGSTASLFAARAILQRLQAGDLFGPQGRNQQVHQRFAGHFAALARAHPDWVTGPFGLGAMLAFTPFDGSPAVAAQVARTLFDLGVIGFVAGDQPTRIRFLPPVPAITDAQIDAACAIIAQALAHVAAGRARGGSK